MNRRVITIFIALVALLAGADTFKSFVFYKNGERVVTVPVADVDSMVFVRPVATPDEPDTPPVNPDSPQDTVPEIPVDTVPDVPVDTVPDVPEPPQFEMVDLGLSVMWASMNVGATTPDDYGNYYAWGELEPKDYYDVSNYSYQGTYLGDDIGATQYDVATATHGDKWRMPSQLECKELITRCTWSWEQYGTDGNWGIKVTGPNGNSIFLPGGGYVNYYGKMRQGDYGSYWTSTADYTDQSHYFCFESSRFEQTSWDGATYVGQLVRPVYGDKPSVTEGALYDFYVAANGHAWNNNSGWLSDAPLSEWYGIETDAEGNVVKISLPDNNLSGECLVDSRLNTIAEVDFRGARFDKVSINTGIKMKVLVLDDCMNVKGCVDDSATEKLILKNVLDMGTLRGSCDTLEVYNCQFTEANQPLGAVTTSSIKLSGCEMLNIGGSANEIYVENSRITESWYFVTREKFTAVNSYLSTVCSGDFYDGALLTFDNATLWRVNWNENITVTVTFSFVFNSDTWYQYFPY